MTVKQDARNQKATIGSSNVLASMPTTAANTGWRAYPGFGLHGKQVLVMHWEGTPSNKSRTQVFYRYEAQQFFAWDINEALEGRYPEFLNVAKYIEHIN